MNGHLERAGSIYQTILKTEPDNLDALTILSDIASRLERLDLAATLLCKAIKLNPQRPDLHNNLGNLLKKLGRVEEGIHHLSKAIKLQPDYAEAYVNRGNGLAMQGKSESALADYRQALHLNPGLQLARTNLLFILNCSSKHSPKEIFQEHRNFAAEFEKQIQESPFPANINKDPERRLRIGYVSADFYAHSVSHFIEPVFANHTHEKFEIFAYHSHTQTDHVTEKLKGYCDQWRFAQGMPVKQLADIIRNDRIDILIDLSGYTAYSSVMTFAYKPAPIQIEWVGYPNTTGLVAMDYKITDAIADPPGLTEHLHTEMLLRMPECFSVYQPPQTAPEVTEPAYARNGYITFASFNNSSKTTGDVIELWSRILKSAPKSKLLLKSAATGDPSTQNFMKKAFAAHGIASERLVLLGYDVTQTSHLGRYADVDIALDPFPYNGTTTSCEALWMGVPIVTLAGTDHRSRVGASLLTSIGHPEWIAPNKDSYLNIAHNLSEDPRGLNEIRSRLRSDMAKSPLTDATRFTHNLECLFRDLWKEWCKR